MDLCPDFALPPASLVLRLAQAGRFNTAMAAARSLDVDMSDLFSHLTTRCLRLSQNPDAVMYAPPLVFLPWTLLPAPLCGAPWATLLVSIQGGPGTARAQYTGSALSAHSWRARVL